MQEMHIGIGPSSHEWARQVDELQISRIEKQVAHNCKEGRVLHRQIQKDALDHLDECFLLYKPGIDESMSV